jgi:hypothetical protein
VGGGDLRGHRSHRGAGRRHPARTGQRRHEPGGAADLPADPHALADACPDGDDLAEPGCDPDRHADADPDTHAHADADGHADGISHAVRIPDTDQPGARQLRDGHPHRATVGIAIAIAFGKRQPVHLCFGGAQPDRNRDSDALVERLGLTVGEHLGHCVADGHAGAVAVTHCAATRRYALPDALSDAPGYLSLAAQKP